MAIAINPLFEELYSNRGNAKFALGEKRSACCDYKQVVSLGNKSTAQWLRSKDGAWCCDRREVSLSTLTVIASETSAH